MKKFIVLISILTVLLCGCSYNNESDEGAMSVAKLHELADSVDAKYMKSPEELINEGILEAPPMHEEVVDEQPEEDRDKIKRSDFMPATMSYESGLDWSMTIDGVLYKLPMLYSDILELDEWKEIIYFEENKDFMPGDTETVTLHKGEQTLVLEITNKKSYVVKYLDCNVTKIGVSYYAWSEPQTKLEIETNLGFKFGDNHKLIVSAYEAYGLFVAGDEDNYTMLYEDADPEPYVIGDWLFGWEDGKLCHVTLEYRGD